MLTLRTFILRGDPNIQTIYIYKIINLIKQQTKISVAAKEIIKVHQSVQTCSISLILKIVSNEHNLISEGSLLYLLKNNELFIDLR